MQIFTLLFIATLAVSSLPNGQGLNDNVKRDFSELSPVEKLLARIFHPEIAAKAQPKLDSSILREYFGGFELFQIDGPSLFLELAGLNDNIGLPDIHTSYEWWICLWGSCIIGFSDIWDVRDTTIERAQETTMKTSINGTKLRIDFHIPDVQIHSPGFVYDSTVLPYGYQTVLRGLDINIKNYTIRFSGDLLLGPEGLRLADLDFFFDVEQLSWRLDNGTRTIDGEVTEIEPQEQDITEIIKEIYWTEEVQERFKRTQEIWVNCFFSNGNISPVKCEKYVEDKYHRQSFAQLVHAIGLGQMLGQG